MDTYMRKRGLVNARWLVVIMLVYFVIGVLLHEFLLLDGAALAGILSVLQYTVLRYS